MQTSVFIAKLAGPLLAVAGLAFVRDPGALREMGGEILRSRSQLFGAGLTAAACGLAIVNVHNRWTGGWPVVVTVLGWTLLAAGIARMLAPAPVRHLGSVMLANDTLLRGIGVGYLALGGFLAYVGYR